MSSLVITGLKVVVEDVSDPNDEDAQSVLAADEAHIRIVAAIVNIALGLLESTSGSSQLAVVGQKLLKHLNRSEHIYEYRLDDMPRWVQVFLHKLRSGFPRVVLSHRVLGEGAAIRQDWASKDRKMQDWDPSKAGHIILNKMMVNDIVGFAGNEQSPNKDELIEYEKLMFLMGITVAHELVHLFVGYLIVDAETDTPPQVSFCPSLYNMKNGRGETIGEAGRAWEGLVLNGCPEALEDPSSRFGLRQAGFICLVDEHTKYKELKHDWMQEILAGNYNFPARLVSKLPGGNRRLRTMRTVRQERLALLTANQASQSESEQSEEKGKLSFRGRSFELLLRIPREPGLLFSPA